MVGTVILARFISPSAFGLVALASPLLLAIEQLQEGGLGSALIYGRGYGQSAWATAFTYYIASSILTLVAIYLFAPLVASALGDPEVTNVFRVLGLVPFAHTMSMVPTAYLERRLSFRGQAGAEVCAAFTQLGLSVALAVGGFGVWSLVVGQCAGALVQTIILWIIVPLRPGTRGASIRMFRTLVGYGRSVTATNVINLAANSVDNLILGSVSGTTQLGYYSQALRLGTFPSTVVGYIVGRAMFPAYAHARDDQEATRSLYLENLQRIAIFALPLSVLMIIAAEPLILGLLGNNWRGAIPVLQILAVFGLLRAFFSPSGELFKGVGRPALGVYYGGAQLVLMIPLLLFFTRADGGIGAAYAVLISLIVAGVPRFLASMRLCDLSAAALAKAMLPACGPSVLLAAALVAMTEAGTLSSPIVELIVIATGGFVVYAIGAIALARPLILPLWSVARRSIAGGHG